MAGKQSIREVTPENDSDEDFTVPGTPLALAGESRGGTAITLAMRTPERLRPRPDLASNVLPTSPETTPAWQLPASTAPPTLGHEARPKRKRKGTIRYKEALEDGYITSTGISQPRE
jgi:hypothetical protein